MKFNIIAIKKDKEQNLKNNKQRIIDNQNPKFKNRIK